MIGGGFGGDFPRKGGKKKPGSTLGPVQGGGNAHDKAKGFVDNGPRVEPANEPHGPGFSDNGPRVISTPSFGHEQGIGLPTPNWSEQPVIQKSMQVVWN